MLWSEKFAHKAVSIKAIHGLRCVAGLRVLSCGVLNFLSLMAAGLRGFIHRYFSCSAFVSVADVAVLMLTFQFSIMHCTE